MDNDFEPPVDPAAPARPVWPAIAHGLRRTCPRCGSGALFGGFLRVRESCPECGEALHHHRADDAPAWLTIIIVAHIVAPQMLLLREMLPGQTLFQSLIAVGAAIVLTLLLLPRTKGAVVGFQWANRMHGFALERDREA